MDSGPGCPGSLADRGLLPFSLGSCLGSAWWRSLREGYCHDLGLLLSLSLTLCCTHTHTHTHMHTDTYTSLSPPPVCYFNQRSRCFAVPPVLTHLISLSIYSGCARGSLSDYCMSCIDCDLLLIVDLEFVPCLVPPGVAESF